jgi:hypothetical protein
MRVLEGGGEGEIGDGVGEHRNPIQYKYNELGDYDLFFCLGGCILVLLYAWRLKRYLKRYCQLISRIRKVPVYIEPGL